MPANPSTRRDASNAPAPIVTTVLMILLVVKIVMDIFARRPRPPSGLNVTYRSSCVSEMLRRTGTGR